MDARYVLSRGIAQLRRERGWTQADLAEAADVSLQFLAALEQGVKTPSLDTLDALAGAFSVPVSELFAAGEPAKAEGAARGEPSRAVLAAVKALPAEREDEIVELLHVVSRMLLKERVPKSSRASAKPAPPKKRPRK